MKMTQHDNGSVYRCRPGRGNRRRCFATLSMTMTQHDKRGKNVRLVSLLASATEIIAELGCLDQLVGRSHECDYPPQVISLPVVSMVQIDVDISSAEIDAQVKQLAQSKWTHDEAALKALSIY